MEVSLMGDTVENRTCLLDTEVSRSHSLSQSPTVYKINNSSLWDNKYLSRVHIICITHLHLDIVSVC